MISPEHDISKGVEMAMTTLFDGADLVDGLWGFHQATDVLIKNEYTAAIGQRSIGSELTDRTIDLDGMTLLPGLIDCHVHLCKGNSVGEQNRWLEPGTFFTERETGTDAAIPKIARDVLAGSYFSRRTLSAGYTTVRDMGGAFESGNVAVREAVNLGFREGPRAFCRVLVELL